MCQRVIINMAPLQIAVLYLSTMAVTSYRSVPSQTDDSPNWTSIGEHVNNHGIAVSQDLLKRNGGPIDYGDLLYIDGVGFKFVNDTMNPRMKNHVDVWVASYEEEHGFDKRFRGKAKSVWLVKKRKQ